MRRVLLISIMSLSVSAAQGATLYKTGDGLFLECQSDVSVNVLGCINYIEGALDQLELARDDRRKSSCVPSGVTGQELRDIMVDYFRSHPEGRQNAAASGVKAALSEAWNCK